MKKIALLSTAIAAVLLAGLPAAKAVNLQLNAVTPLDTFSFDVVGFNTTSGNGFFLTPLETATFGATTTFTSVGYNGQNITITSSETVGATTTTDTFTVSTPVNFLTSPTINGTTINFLGIDIGDTNSGGNMISLVLPIASYTATGSFIYGAGNTTINGLTPNTQLGTGNLSYSASLGVFDSTGAAISAQAVHSFTYSITYATIPLVPEPSTWAMLGFGAIVGGVMVRRRLAV